MTVSTDNDKEYQIRDNTWKPSVNNDFSSLNFRRKNNVEPSKPLVSVILPTYNDIEHIPDALSSLSQQTYENIEVIIIDSSKSEKLGDAVKQVEWIIYKQSDPEGVAQARNYGINCSDGDLIAFLDADDIWHPKKLEIQVNCIQDGYSVVTSDYYELEVQENSAEVTVVQSNPKNNPHIQRLNGNISIQTSTLMVESCVLPDDPFIDDLKYGEDIEFMVNIFMKNELYHIDMPLSIYRIHSDSLTSSSREFKYAQRNRLYGLLEYKHPQLKNAIDTARSDNEYRMGLHLLKKRQFGSSKSHLMASFGLESENKKVALLLTFTAILSGIERFANLNSSWFK